MPRLRAVQRPHPFRATFATQADSFAKLLELLPQAITTRYWSNSLNPTLRLGWVRTKIRVGDREETHQALVSLTCQPTPRLVIEVPEGVSPELFFESIDKGEEVEVIETSSVPPLPRRYSPRPEPFVARFPRTSFGDGGALYRVGFGLFNVPDIYGTVVKLGRGTQQMATAGRVPLLSDEWFVAIDPSIGLRDRYQLARSRGAYFLSHAGALGRIDGGTFTEDHADEILSALYWLLSFALGRRTGPALPFGVTQASDRPIWTQWSIRATDAIGGVGTWFDFHHPESLNEIFGPFLRIWHDEDLRKVLIRVISWYVEAQGLDPVETAIPAAQIALETLAATIPLRPDLDDPTLGSKAAGKHARLLKRLGIPIEIPAELQDLQRASGSKPWEHGPEAITHLRNDITHPRQDRAWTGAAMIEAWKLSLWYVELSLLAWLDYRGVYNRRTRMSRWVGLVEPVPWEV